MKKVEFLIMAFMLGLTVTSCVKKSEEAEVSVINIEGHRVVTDDDFPVLHMPRQIGNCLFSRLANEKEKGYVGFLEGNSLVSKRTFLPKGQGPMEYNDISVSNVGDSILVVMNSMGMGPSSVDFYRLDELITDGIPSAERYSLDVDRLSSFRGGNRSFVLLTDSTVLINSGTLERGGIFSILNLNTSEVEELDWSLDDGIEVAPIVKQGVYVDNTYMCKNGDDIFYLSGNGMFAMIFRIEDGKLLQKKVLFDTYPEYRELEDGLNYGMKLTTNELSACANEDGIYILELDRDRNNEITEDEHTVRWYGKTVHYFDWDGKNIVDYNLDKFVTKIMVSSDNKSLYGIRLYAGDDDDEIYGFKTGSKLSVSGN